MLASIIRWSKWSRQESMSARHRICCLAMLVIGAVAKSSGIGAGLSISGYVRDEDNHQPLKGATLELMGTSGSTAPRR